MVPLRAAAAWTLSLALAGCASPHRRPEPPPLIVEPILHEWYGDHLAGPLAIRIDLSEQRATLTLGGVDAGWMTVATGKAGHETPTGSFRVMEKIADKFSSHYGRLLDAEGNVYLADADARKDRPPPGGRFDPAPMPYWMRLTRYGIGMHAGPIPNPGDPASKGCIRMPKAIAPIVFSHARVGTPVTIVP